MDRNVWMIFNPCTRFIDDIRSDVPSMVRLMPFAIPPRLSLFSTRSTLNPWSAMARAAVIPAMPPPTTSAFWMIGSWGWGKGFAPLSFSSDIFRMVSMCFSVRPEASRPGNAGVRISTTSMRAGESPVSLPRSTSFVPYRQGMQAPITILLEPAPLHIFHKRIPPRLRADPLDLENP